MCARERPVCVAALRLHTLRAGRRAQRPTVGASPSCRRAAHQRSSTTSALRAIYMARGGARRRASSAVAGPHAVCAVGASRADLLAPPGSFVRPKAVTGSSTGADDDDQGTRVTRSYSASVVPAFIGGGGGGGGGGRVSPAEPGHVSASDVDSDSEDEHVPAGLKRRSKPGVDTASAVAAAAALAAQAAAGGGRKRSVSGGAERDNVWITDSGVWACGAPTARRVPIMPNVPQMWKKRRPWQLIRQRLPWQVRATARPHVGHSLVIAAAVLADPDRVNAEVLVAKTHTRRHSSEGARSARRPSRTARVPHVLVLVVGVTHVAAPEDEPPVVAPEDTTSPLVVVTSPKARTPVAQVTPAEVGARWMAQFHRSHAGGGAAMRMQPAPIDYTLGFEKEAWRAGVRSWTFDVLELSEARAARVPCRVRTRSRRAPARHAGAAGFHRRRCVAPLRGYEGVCHGAHAAVALSGRRARAIPPAPVSQLAPCGRNHARRWVALLLWRPRACMTLGA